MNSNAPKAKIYGSSPNRIYTDGKGITTLIGFQGCPLRCKYCLNPGAINFHTNRFNYTPKEIYDQISRGSRLYFLATGGGITFGGGEPAINPEFIKQFREICDHQWSVNIETSLNVPNENILQLLPHITQWIIDIKDMNPQIYQRYTGSNNKLVLENLKIISEQNLQDRCIIRIPLIPTFNTKSDQMSSKLALENLGFRNFDFFTYVILKRQIPKEGFRICYTLRDVRNAIAKANEIPFISYPCNNPHDNCSGNCPLCNEEVKYLVEKLDDLHNAGKNISIIGIASNILKKRDPLCATSRYQYLTASIILN